MQWCALLQNLFSWGSGFVKGTCFRDVFGIAWLSAMGEMSVAVQGVRVNNAYVNACVASVQRRKFDGVEWELGF